MPSPVSAEVCSSSRHAPRSHLLPTTRRPLRPCEQRGVLRGERPGSIHHHQGQVGVRHRLEAAFDAQALHRLGAFANAGRIDELHRDAADGSGLRYQVARGAGDVCDDGAILLQQAVEKAALADVRAPHDGQRQPAAHQSAVLETGGQLRDAFANGRQAAQNLRGRRDADIVFGEVDAGFEQGDQLHQLFFQAAQCAARPSRSTCWAATRAW